MNTSDLLREAATKSRLTSYDIYEVGPAEPITELIEPEKAWIVRCKYDSQVLVTCGDAALPMIDIDNKHGLLPALFERMLLSTELNLQLRVYETAHGFRLLVESQTLKPEGATFAVLARAFDCDQRYLTLCQKQQCYRARLTVKPGAADDARVCRYLGTIGSAGIDETLAPLIQLHDERSGALLPSGELG
jgi:hypothetical protein